MGTFRNLSGTRVPVTSSEKVGQGKQLVSCVVNYEFRNILLLGVPTPLMMVPLSDEGGRGRGGAGVHDPAPAADALE